MEPTPQTQSMLETALDHLANQAALLSEHLLEVETLRELESIRDRANAFARNVSTLAAAQRRLAKVAAGLNPSTPVE